jgi:glyoxylase-like metal-dependent hydrolase (beta-lactamase superfamily II)
MGIEMKLKDQTPPEVAEGVFQLGTRWVNFHLVVDGSDAILVDAGYPRYTGRLEQALRTMGRRLRDVSAVIVTHHHVDHAGTAEHVRRSGATVYAGTRDVPIIKGERASHPPQGFYREAWRPSMIAYLTHTVRVGGAGYRPCEQVEPLADDETLELPGRPRVLMTPGHTAGHCSVALPDRGVLLVGDAMVNFDYASGARGLKLHRFNEDRDEAIQSLDRLEPIEADTVLFGHGEPWRQGVRSAVESVRMAAS